MIRIKNINDFELVFNEVFGNLDRTTLSKIKNQRLRIDLGGEEVNSQRITQALDRSDRILQYCFGSKTLWLRIILWSRDEEGNLIDAGLKINRATKIFKQKNEDEILYLHFERYSKLLLSPITRSIINFDLAKNPSANITCYFINFNSKIIVNIYDDRGLDIFTPNEDLFKEIKNQFSNWLI